MRRVTLAFLVLFVPGLLSAQAGQSGEDRSCVGKGLPLAQVKAKADELSRNGQLGAAACWYRLGVSALDTESEIALANIYRSGGKGVQQNVLEAITLYTLAARQSPIALYALAEIYEAGEGGVTRNVEYAAQLRAIGKQLGPQQPPQVTAVRPNVGSGGKTESAAPGGTCDARSMTAHDAYMKWVMVMAGASPSRFIEATCWLKAAAAKGEPEAQHRVGVMYLYGDTDAGIAANPQEGVRLLMLSAEQGNTDAAKALALLFEGGGVVAKNPAMAKHWSDMAAGRIPAPSAPGGASAQFDGVMALLFGSNGKPVPGVPKPTSPADPTMPPPHIDPKGWEKLRWGMSKPQVQQVYRDAVDYPTQDKRQVFGIPHFGWGDTQYEVEMEFAGAGLARVTMRPRFYSLIYPLSYNDQAESFFKKLFTYQFGEPRMRTESARAIRSRTSVDGSGDIEERIDFSPRASTRWTWQLGTTQVELLRRGGAPAYTIQRTHPRLNRIDEVTEERVEAGPDNIILYFSALR